MSYRAAEPDRVTQMKPTCRAGVFFLLMIGLGPAGAAAQNSAPLLPWPVPPGGPRLPAAPGDEPSYAGQTVTSRLRPEFDPIGLRVGSFFWFPRAELDEAHNSNIFA